MRAREFLLEYDRQKTADSIGPALIAALANDRSVTLPHFLTTLRQRVKGLSQTGSQRIEAVIPPAQIKDNINAILAGIEDRDPSPNKQYSQWLARTYARGGVSMEDLNRFNLIGAYDIAKKRKKIKPEHADINRFKFYQDFEDAMEHHYNNFEDLDAEQRPEGTASKVYNDENVTIVVPEDEAAACKYGRGTRWCTASTRGDNYFNAYNRTGKLYILIPKKPKWENEKYQLHFSSNSYMDENDDPVDVMWLLNDRFPGLSDFFVKIEPELKEKILFAPDEEIQKAIESVAELVQERVWETISEWETDDDYYRQYLRDEGFVDEEGDIDWDRVADEGLSYTEYNDHADRWAREIWNTVTPSPQELKDIIENDPYEYQNFDTMKHIPDVIGTILKEKYRYDRDSSDQGIGDWLRQKVSMKKEGDTWKPYVIHTSYNR